MKTTRLNKSTRIAVKPIQTMQVQQDYVDTFVGRTAVLKSLPTSVKRAKRLFEIDKQYKVQKPTGLKINTPMSVHLKGSDGAVHQVQFMHYYMLPN